MEQYILGLFQQMSLLTAVLLGAGVLLCVIEVFVPKVGVVGFLGIALTALGMSSYYIDGFKLKQLVSLLSIIAFVLALFIMIELVLEGKGVIKNPDRYKFRTYSNSINDLIGKVGKAYTNIDLGGTIDIDGKLYYAVASAPIEQGCFVKVVAINNNKLVVVRN